MATDVKTPSKKKQKLQFNTALAVTKAIRGTSIGLMYRLFVTEY